MFKQLYCRNQELYHVFVFLEVVVDNFLLKDVCEFNLQTNRILKLHNEERKNFHFFEMFLILFSGCSTITYSNMESLELSQKMTPYETTE